MASLEIIECLEQEWDAEGFLGRLRQGSFGLDEARAFLSMLKTINIPDGSSVPKRLLSLVWYIPSFLEWQKERVIENGGDKALYEKFVTDVQNSLEISLGVP